ncbi:hypothetical protein GQ42DRAFT_47134 [Ramicandelaber brevisporus]|nr:hypothetical protein GQ42DRAFT_47134 [Ramicandelaber brevisporus]
MTNSLTATMSDQAYFRLFDLPGELVEYISFFFDVSEAHELLTVSHACHDLFAKRVWWKLDSRMFTILEPTRSIAMARYGLLIRRINFDHRICDALKLDINYGGSICSVLGVFSDATTLKLNLWYNLFVSNGIQFTDIIMCFPKLYNLVVVIEKDNEPYDLVTLAHAINHRQNNHNMSPIEYLKLSYHVKSNDNPWARLSNFMQMVTSTYKMEIEIAPWSTTSVIPSQSELQVLGKYFTNSPNIDKREDTQFCYAALNRSLFCKSFDTYNWYPYPPLLTLSIRTCCMSSYTYDYNDITRSNFPRIQSINIYDHECNSKISNFSPPAWEKVLLQTWSHLRELQLSVNMTCKQLVDIMEYHHKLTYLVIWMQPKMLDENNTFNLAPILPLLPKLQDLSIYGTNVMRLDYNPDYDDSEILARSQLNHIQFSSLDLSSRIFKFFYSLPKLRTIFINYCKFYSTGIGEVADIDNVYRDPNSTDISDDKDNDNGNDNDAGNDDNLYEELMAVLITVSKRYLINNPNIIKCFILQLSSGGYDWPLDLTLEMIAQMPQLRILSFKGEIDDIQEAVKVRFPYVDVTQEFISHL